MLRITIVSKKLRCGRMMSTGSVAISPPPQFMPSRPQEFGCEGYWSPPLTDGHQPIICKKMWPDKVMFVRATDRTEQHLVQTNQYKSYRGYASSRLIPGKLVGAKEYHDKKYNMSWPEGYVNHYIDQHNMMPTKEFYEYVAHRINTIPE